MFIDVPGAKLLVTQSGPRSAPAIVAVGGWIGSGELWQQPLAALSGRWHTITYDHRGSGASICTPASITLYNLVADVFAVMDACGVERCVLAAESAGALTALSAALAHPQRIDKLVIVDGMFDRGVAPADDPFLKGLHANYPATLARFVDLCVPEEGMDHIKRWGRQIIDRATQENAIALRVMGSLATIRASLPNIKQPTLVLHGDRDVIVPLEQANLLASTLPHARLVVLEGAGHVPTLTQPQRVVDEMRAFLEST